MRRTQVLILKIMIDSDAPSALRGTLALLAEPTSRPFQDAQALLALIAELTRADPVVQSLEGEQASRNNRLPPVP